MGIQDSYRKNCFHPKHLNCHLSLTTYKPSYIIPLGDLAPDFFDMEASNTRQGRPAVQSVALESMAPSTTTDTRSATDAAPIDNPPSSEENQNSSKPVYENQHTKDDPEAGLSAQNSASSGDSGGQDLDQIRKLVSRMFGRERKENSQEEKMRHSGVVWKDLTVKGVGVGAVIQPTILDIFLGIPRLVKKLLTKGRKSAGTGKPPTRTIIDGFTVCSSELHYTSLNSHIYRAVSVLGRCFSFLDDLVQDALLS